MAVDVLIDICPLLPIQSRISWQVEALRTAKSGVGRQNLESKRKGCKMESSGKGCGKLDDCRILDVRDIMSDLITSMYKVGYIDGITGRGYNSAYEAKTVIVVQEIFFERLRLPRNFT